MFRSSDFSEAFLIHVYFSDCGFSGAFSTLLSEISIKQVIIFTNGAFLCKFLFFVDPCLLKDMYFSFFYLVGTVQSTMMSFLLL